MSDGPPLGAQLKNHKTELLVGGAGVVMAIALYVKSKGSSSSTTPATTTTGTGTVVEGTSVATTTGTDIYGGLENQILGLQQAVLGLSTNKPTTTTPKTPTPNQGKGHHRPGGPTSGAGGGGAAASTPGISEATFGGEEYDVLGGFEATGKYSGWNVSTDEPVDFTWTGQGTPELGAPPAGATGVVAYTPASTPRSDIGNHTAGVVPGWSQGYT